ncbi:hypothetical protein HCN51_03880 [Nonomuraea sp. FMUSA5-5]|uniref:Secreted protein n=1 Tax=Nonomuraea composti TaxID=2720023 RepID=A0ABX1AX45_9ACTN|nr:hypothetical protein [Nonomuraea sp. FMUSA5-5]NJP88604.1 hypothetical protein [Nonomuraea sp. FMUSA5-5]
MKARLLLAAAALALSGCGTPAAQDDGVVSAGGGTASATPAASPSASLDPDQAALKFAQCMREHGIDMPDPQEGRIMLKIPKGMDQKKVEQAQKACRPIMDAVVNAGERPADAAGFDQLVKFAQCMREQGIDMADPQPGQPLRFDGRGQSKEKLEAAQKACEEYAPGFAKKETP